MYCPKCGSVIQQGARFCQKCGTPADQPAVPAPAAKPVQPNPVQRPAAQPVPVQKPAAPQAPANRPSVQQPAAPKAPVQPPVQQPAAPKAPVQPPAAQPKPVNAPPVQTPPAQPPVQGAYPQGYTAPAPKKLGTKKLVIIIAAAAAAFILLVGGIVGAVLYNSPNARMERLLRDGKYSEAVTLYFDELSGEPMSEKAVEIIESTVAETVEAYEAGELSYEDARDKIQSLSFFSFDGAGTLFSGAYNTIDTKYRVDTALEEADALFGEGSYDAAYSQYQYVLTLDAENELGARGVEKSLAAIRAGILEQVQTAQSSNDFAAAISVLEQGIQSYFAEDAELIGILDGLRVQEAEYIAAQEKAQKEQEIQQVVDQAYAATEGGDWEGALDLITEKQQTDPDNEKLRQAYDDIQLKMPMTLKNLTRVNEERIEIKSEVIKDRWGGHYDGGLKLSKDGYVLYNLGKRFTKLKGTIMVPDWEDEKMNGSISIYLDEALVYFVDGITLETPPAAFDIDVTDKTTMRIVFSDAEYWSKDICIVDSKFVKVGETE